jgi:hypothetical protein
MILELRKVVEPDGVWYKIYLDDKFIACKRNADVAYELFKETERNLKTAPPSTEVLETIII